MWLYSVVYKLMSDLYVLIKILFSHSFVLEAYTALLQDTTTQRRSQPSHGQRIETIPLAAAANDILFKFLQDEPIECITST